MGDSPQSDLYAFLRRAWAQKRWFTLLLFIPFAAFVMVAWHAVETLSDRAGKSLGVTVEEFIQSFLRSGAPNALKLRENPSGNAPWLEIALKEVGQKEIPGSGNNSRILEYIRAVRSTDNVQDDDVDWASAFVEWSFNQSGIRGPRTMEPANWLNWGRIVNVPERGCVVVFSFGGIGHVGFFLEDDGASYVVLGGNQSDEVRTSRFHKARALGFRMPP
jgi:uncharacterized protein (TIGR02594 family)